MMFTFLITLKAFIYTYFNCFLINTGKEINVCVGPNFMNDWITSTSRLLALSASPLTQLEVL